MIQSNLLDNIQSYCNKHNIGNDNYLACTIKLSNLNNHTEQLQQIEAITSTLTFPYIGAVEFSTNKANGYHFHFICEELQSNINELVDKNIHVSTKYKEILAWQRYIAKEDVTKNIIKKTYTQSNTDLKPLEAIKEVDEVVTPQTQKELILEAVKKYKANKAFRSDLREFKTLKHISIPNRTVKPLEVIKTSLKHITPQNKDYHLSKLIPP